MPKIVILTENVINKIAAGEVIERPASIVRELIDNSIDAGAGKISVELLHGGKKLIRVSDDGTGMDRDDASLCFERHATSKIASEDSLYSITTLGFRGEALSSISSVSKVTLVTSTMNSPVGTKVESHAGHGREISDAPPVPGTTIEVRDIFFNTPARRKFLKSTATELSHSIDVVIQKACAYPALAFSLVHNGSEIIHVTRADTLRDRFHQLYGEEFAGEFLDIVPEGDERIRVYGFCSAQQHSRATRGNQYVFVNRRPVKNPTVSHAAYSVYREILPKERHPSFFLFLDVNPLSVDMNVHPAKREVRFESPDEIHGRVLHAVRRTLFPEGESREGYAGNRERSVFPPPEGTEGRSYYAGEPVRSVSETFSGVQTSFLDSETGTHSQRYFAIGDVFVARISDSGLEIFDRHAVHERIYYERFLKKIPLEVENLLLPIRVELPSREFSVIMGHKGVLSDLGFDIEDFGSKSVIVRSLPKGFGRADVRTILLDAAEEIQGQEALGGKGSSQKEETLKKVAARLACHTAVRGRESLNDEELGRLMADLEKTEVPDRCPHGRPTRILFSPEDLRKMFKRK